jgi:hypothetical protein
MEDPADEPILGVGHWYVRCPSCATNLAVRDDESAEEVQDVLSAGCPACGASYRRPPVFLESGV